MLPAQRNKVDISKLTPAEQQAFRMYGKLPNRPVQNKNQERKYFDSGDWVLAKEGKAKGVGTAHPKAEEIPHASPTPIGTGSSPSGTPGSVGGGFPSSSPPGSIGMGMGSPPSASSPSTSSSAATTGGIPIPGATSTSSSVDLSMSPGRVGVGQPLASSPTRSMHSSFSARDHANHHHHPLNSSTSPSSSSSLAARMATEQDQSSSIHIGNPLDANTPTGSTGNVVGRAQQRPLPGQEPNYLTSPAVSQPTSGLANSVSTEADGMDLQ